MGRYRDVSQIDKQLFPGYADDKIMHATLQLNEETVLMGCDGLEINKQSETAFANNFYLYINADNEEDAYRIFNDLSAEGKILMPIGKTFWSTHYGMVTDKFGICWKITFDPNKK